MQTKWIRLVVPLLAVVVMAGCALRQPAGETEQVPASAPESQENQNAISPEEQAFLDSGRAKAIEDETDLWMIHEVPEAGLSVRYPHDVTMEARDRVIPYLLTVTAYAVDGLDGTMGYNEETARANMESLSVGEYGQPVDFSFSSSRRVRPLGDTHAQDFLVFGRFEVCDVRFERKLYFFSEGQQVVLTLAGDPERLVGLLPDHFRVDEANCGSEWIWDADSLAGLVAALKEGSAPAEVQRWYDAFDEIVDAIRFDEFPPEDETFDLTGRWRSLDDPKSEISFYGGFKRDYYDGEEISFEAYGRSGTRLSVGQGMDAFEYEILELTDDSLVMSYLARGNTLRYEKVD